MEADEAAIEACRAKGWPVIATVADEIGLTKLALAPGGVPGRGSNGGWRKAVIAVAFGQNSSEVVAG